MGRTIVVLAVAALFACRQSDSKQAQPGGPAGETELKVGSRVDDLRIVATTKLPTNPKPRIDEYCSSVGFGRIKPTSPGGRLAARNGWILTSETKLGKYDTVTFVGALDAMTSATCLHRNGNLAIFDGPQLKAIVYEPPERNLDPDDIMSEDSLGFAEQIDARRIRLHWGLPAPPFADVVLNNGLFVEPTAAEDKVCGGTAVVPNIFNQDIRKARKKLRSFGWLPLKTDPDGQRLSAEQELIAQGVIELESCSGTGYGFCGFNYRNAQGFTLHVVSQGEEQKYVDNYGVECGNQK